MWKLFFSLLPLFSLGAKEFYSKYEIGKKGSKWAKFDGGLVNKVMRSFSPPGDWLLLFHLWLRLLLKFWDGLRRLSNEGLRFGMGTLCPEKDGFKLAKNDTLKCSVLRGIQGDSNEMGSMSSGPWSVRNWKVLTLPPSSHISVWPLLFPRLEDSWNSSWFLAHCWQWLKVILW